MKKLVFALVFVFATVVVFADNGNTTSTENNSTAATTTTVNGQVVDLQSGESLAGAEVVIEGTNFVTYTDLDGNFSFANVTAGTYTIVIRYISYKNSLVENMVVNTTSNNSLQVQLIPESN